MKILLLGGTGAMGAHMVRLFQSMDYDIYVTSRSERTGSERVHYIKGNALDESFMIPFLKNDKYDVIVDFMSYTESEFASRINYLLDATKQYIFLSSSRVYADSENPITEASDRLLDISQDSAFLSKNDYALAKARQEDVLKKNSRLNWTIVRPYITYGEYRLQLGILEKEKWLYRSLKGRTIVFSKDIAEHFTTLSYGYDVSKCIAGLVGQEEALANIYHITTSEAIRWNDVLHIYTDAIKQITGKEPKLLIVNSVYDMGISKPNYQVDYDRLFDRIFDNSKINKLLGTTNNGISVQDGLRKCVETFLENPEFQAINWKEEALKDKICGEISNLSEIADTRAKIEYIVYRFTPWFKIKCILKKIIKRY